MQKHPLILKGLVIAVIFLFIGVAFAPNINVHVVKAFTDKEFIEVTSEVCGITGFGNHTVKLTQKQYSEVQKIFDNLKIKLDKAKIKEEAIKIFNEAVIDLNEFGLLPDRLSIKQAQKLVTGGYQNSKIVQRLEKILSKESALLDNNSNYLCFIAGNTTSTWVIPLVGMTLNRILLAGYDVIDVLDTLFPLKEWKRLNSFLELLTLLIVWLNIATPMVSESIPIGYGNGISLGYRFVNWDGEIYNPAASGSIITFGLLGKKSWDGEMYGQIHPFITLAIDYIGATGFTGLKIYQNHKLDYHYFGFARYVNISYELPEFFDHW